MFCVREITQGLHSKIAHFVIEAKHIAWENIHKVSKQQKRQKTKAKPNRQTKVKNKTAKAKQKAET